MKSKAYNDLLRVAIKQQDPLGSAGDGRLCSNYKDVTWQQMELCTRDIATLIRY